MPTIRPFLLDAVLRYFMNLEPHIPFGIGAGHRVEPCIISGTSIRAGARRGGARGKAVCSMLGPVLQGTLLVLSPIEPEHLQYFCRWSRDPAGIRYMEMQYPLTLADESQWYQRIATAPDGVFWAILLHGQLIGNIALANIDWVSRHASSGIWIGDTSQHGKGYGTEAMRLRTRYAFEELGLEKVMTSIMVGNEASRRATERVGYRHCGLRRRHIWRGGKWHDVWLGEILRDDWLAAQSQP